MTAARLDMVPHSLNSGQYPVAGEDLHTATTVHGDGKSSRAPSVRKIDRRAIPDTDFAGCGDRTGALKTVRPVKLAQAARFTAILPQIQPSGLPDKRQYLP